MQRLLIADDSETRSNALKEALQTDWEIHICTDSYPVIETIRYTNPDALIINLDICPQNGLSVLDEAFPGLPPVILALSNITSPYVMQTCESLGVSMLMQTPCKIDHIKEQLENICRTHWEGPTLLKRHLHALGISKRFNGYRCLLAAIPLFQRDPSLMLKEVFPVVAKRCGLNDSRCVEHAIRVAIRAAWERRETAIWDYYFHTPTRCPSNKEFIAQIAELL